MDSGEKKKKVKMEGKSAGVAGKGEDVVEQFLGNGDTEQDQNTKKEGNFFDFQDDVKTDVWKSNFTSTLRKGR